MVLLVPWKDAILAQPDGIAAFAFYSVLVDAHGHTPGKRFSLSQAAMRKTRLSGMGRPTFIRACDLLLELGLLRRAGGYVPGKKAQEFQLGRLVSGDGGDGADVLDEAPVALFPQTGEFRVWRDARRPIPAPESRGRRFRVVLMKGAAA